MSEFSKFNEIRNGVNKKAESVKNISAVSNESGFRSIHILWLYPDVMNIHGGRGDVMGIIHVANLLGIPVEIRRADYLKQDIDWQWPHMVYMTAGELKCVPDVVSALRRQESEIKDFIKRGGSFVANGSSGAVLADEVELWDERKIQGLGLLHMDWRVRESVWGDDIWLKVAIDDGEIDLIGNQIQLADVTLHEGQEALGRLVYGRGNDGSLADGGSGKEGARTGNVIYTGVLGPLITKNPHFTASLLKEAAAMAGIREFKEIRDEDIDVELKSAEYIKQFMQNKL